MQVKAEFKEDKEKILLTLNGKEIECHIFKSGKIKFSYQHPDADEPLSYEGIVEDSKLWLYPMIGEYTLATEPINIK